MGVDASYAFGYMINASAVQFDFDVLRKRFDLNDYRYKNSDGKPFEWSLNYGQLIEEFEKAIEEEGDDILGEYVDYFGFSYVSDPYSDEFKYVYITHHDVIREFPNEPMNRMDELAGELLRKMGVANAEDATWEEFAYFS